MLAVSGVIAASSIGWPGIFYVSGAFGVVWGVAFYIFGSDSPSECASITKEEREYITSMPGSSNDRKKTIPWKEISTSKPFWALLISHCAQNWGFWTLLTQIPSYMNHVLNFDIKSVFESSLAAIVLQIRPFILCFCFAECLAVGFTILDYVDTELSVQRNF